MWSGRRLSMIRSRTFVCSVEASPGTSQPVPERSVAPAAPAAPAWRKPRRLRRMRSRGGTALSGGSSSSEETVREVHRFPTLGGRSRRSRRGRSGRSVADAPGWSVIAPRAQPSTRYADENSDAHPPSTAARARARASLPRRRGRPATGAGAAAPVRLRPGASAGSAGPAGQVLGRLAGLPGPAPVTADRARGDRPARRRSKLARSAARAALLRRPHGARLHAVGAVQAGRGGPQGEPGVAPRARAPLPLVRPLHPPADGHEGARLPRPCAVRPAGFGAADDGHAPSGRRLLEQLPGRRTRRGQAHARLVRRLRSRDRRRARGDRIRARLARNRGLPRAEPPQRAPAHPALRRGRALEAAERNHLPRGGRLRLGAGQAHGQAVALHRRQQGARLHAQRHPPRLDAGERAARPRHLAPRGRQALRDQHLVQRARSGALPQVDLPQPSPLADDQRLVPPEPSRPRPAAEHGHEQLEGGRIPVPEPPGLLGGRL